MISIAEIVLSPRHIARLILGPTISLLLFVAAPADNAVAFELPPGAEPVSAVELYMLYKDKTWKWVKGAGRFYSKDRRFLAWAPGDNGDTYAQGRFILTDSGRVCLDAAWRNGEYAISDRTCFIHNKVGETTYQQREGTSDWYFFKHTPLEDSDEYAKFTSSDLVIVQITRIKEEMQIKHELWKGDMQ